MKNFFFTCGSSAGGMPGAVVADAYGDGRVVMRDVYVDLFAVFAVFAGVIENVEEHLREPLRVAGDLRKVFLRRNIGHGEIFVAEKLIIGIKAILDQRRAAPPWKRAA